MTIILPLLTYSRNWNNCFALVLDLLAKSNRPYMIVEMVVPFAQDLRTPAFLEYLAISLGPRNQKTN